MYLNDLQPNVTRLGITEWNVNLEGLHGLGAVCLTLDGSTRCPTIYAAPPALGATFNTSLLHAIGSAVTDEVRAYNNAGGHRQYDNRPVDASIWLPNANVGRDPRWGRQVETYGEDPLHIGRMAAAMIDGAQYGDDGKGGRNTSAPYGYQYLKAIVAAKHGTAYSVETDRFGFNALVTQHDLADTYYPAWEVIGREGRASGYMCSYPSINGVPCCGNPELETGLMKGTWGIGQDGHTYIQGDCGAIGNIFSAHGYCKNASCAAATAINAGTTTDCGDALGLNLLLALDEGLTNSSVVDQRVTDLLYLQFLTGRFDPLPSQPFTTIPFEAIHSDAHLTLAHTAAQQGMVLLRNDAGLLPLPAGLRIAVIGPHGNTSVELLGNYYEDACPGQSGNGDCVPSLLAALTAAYTGGSSSVTYAPGCAINDLNTSAIPAAVAAASAADVVVLALGTDSSVAAEGFDRSNTSLPGVQEQLALAVLGAGKPSVLLLFSGTVLALDSVLAARPAAEPTAVAAPALAGASSSGTAASAPLAVVQAYFPGTPGAVPVVEQLLQAGGANRWGKLAYTWYPAVWSTKTVIEDMNMTGPPSTPTGGGRTYKYYDPSFAGQPLWSFGEGLSYTTFAITRAGNTSSSSGSGGSGAVLAWRAPSSAALARLGTVAAAGDPASSATVSFNVTNTGAVAGDEVVFLFAQPNASSLVQAAQQQRRYTGAGEAAASGPGPFNPPVDPLARQWLVAFQRITLQPGQSALVSFNVSSGDLRRHNAGGRPVVWPGRYQLVATNGNSGQARAAAAVGVHVLPALTDDAQAC